MWLQFNNIYVTCDCSVEQQNCSLWYVLYQQLHHAHAHIVCAGFDHFLEDFYHFCHALPFLFLCIQHFPSQSHVPCEYSDFQSTFALFVVFIYLHKVT